MIKRYKQTLHLFHIFGYKHSIYTAESNLRDDQKHVDHVPANKHNENIAKMLYS
jgi:hypothetical protein